MSKLYNHNIILPKYLEMVKEIKPAEKSFCRSEDGSAGGGWGGGGGGEPRAGRAEVRRAPPPARSEQNTKEKFCFPFRRKNPARANPKMRTKLFFGVASVSERRRGGSVVSFKEGSRIFK